MDHASFIAALYREEYGRILPTLIRVFADFTVAEDALQEAFCAALEQWPREGTPLVPRAWIIQTAKHRAIDRMRRAKRLAAKLTLLEPLIEGLTASLESPDVIADDQLRLFYTCCHPSLALDVQVALTLRTSAGLTTDEIARACLVPTPAMAQRLVRAQRKIRDAAIPYEVPDASERRERTEAVLTCIYLTFNEGYSATGGEALLRVDLCEEAIRLGGTVVSLLAGAPRAEALALLSLMVMHHARRDARVASDGSLVLLDQQDRSLWRTEEAQRGLAFFHEALGLGAHGRYATQAAIAALHLQARTAEDTDWPQIVGLYDRLMRIAPSPIVALNRAAAVAMAEGAERGLAQIDDLASRRVLGGYHLLPAARADLLRRLGRWEEAAAAYRQALSGTCNDAERRFLTARLGALSTDR